MSLHYFQERLQSIYEIDIEHSVHDFLITDKRLADHLSFNSSSINNEERLLFMEHEDGLELSLYISADVIRYLEDAHPTDLVQQGNYSEFCLMLEGVSHFLYLIWNAQRKRKITMLEMELQAEVDKFILLHSLLNDKQQGLSYWLFENNSYNELLNDIELERYRQANYYAAKYCKGLQQQFRVNDLNNDLLRELRRFYRLVQGDKFRYINQQLH